MHVNGTTVPTVTTAIASSTFRGDPSLSNGNVHHGSARAQNTAAQPNAQTMIVGAG